MNCFEHVDWSRFFAITPKRIELLTYRQQYALNELKLSVL
jgi:hypothetical protein